MAILLDLWQPDKPSEADLSRIELGVSFAATAVVELCRRGNSRLLVGISGDERETTFRHIGLLNHDWNNPDALVEIGTLEKEQIQQIAGENWHPSLGGDTPVRINKLVLDYDHILIVGPTFPHEVVGFSGGAKYLFPGISGAEMINTTHWLGALITGYGNRPYRGSTVSLRALYRF